MIAAVPAAPATSGAIAIAKDTASAAAPAPTSTRATLDPRSRITTDQHPVGRNVTARGWCPGALRPMESGDGLIVRLRIGGGIVCIPLALDIARWADRWGNGQIDLSSRANLQLRGLSPRCLPELREALAAWDLLDRDVDAEAIRNITCSPLAGLDPDAALDIRPIATELGRRLTLDATLRSLPAKFGFVIDDGGRPGLGRMPADIRCMARRTSDGPHFEIALGGACGRLGPSPPDEVVETSLALARLFLSLRTGRETTIRRMGDLVDADGLAAIGRQAGLDVISQPAPTLDDGTDVLGPRPLGNGAILGIGLPFGRIAAADLAQLASAAAANGARELRLTPWRAVLVPVPSTRAARALSAELATGAFNFDADDPRRRIAACPGAPDCARATTAVRHDAARLAAALTGMEGPGIVLHVSGCEKGCAHSRTARITLVAHNGHYNIVRDGKPSDVPVLSDLSFGQVIEHIRQDGVAGT